MDILGRAKRKTAVYSAARLDSEIVQHELNAGDEIHIRGMKKVGIQSFYRLDGADYVFSDDVQIVRDLEFYYDNYTNKKFQRNNVNMFSSGFNSVIAPATKFTSSYNFLQAFADSDNPGEGWKEISTEYVPENNPEGETDLGGFVDSIIPTFGGVSGGGLGIGTSLSEIAIPAGTFGINDDFGILNDVTVGSLFDGSLLDILGDNIADAIGKWASSKLAFVVGFDFASGHNLFSSIFSSLFGRSGGSDLFSSLFGGGSRGGSGSSMLGNWKPVDGMRLTAFAKGLGYSRKIKYTKTSQEALAYFSYKDYIPDESNPFYFNNASQIITGYTLFDDLKGGIPTKNIGTNTEKTKFLRNMFQSDYQEEHSLLDAIKLDLNITVDRATRFNKFNRWRMPHVDHELGYTRGYVFFSVPDLNLSMEKQSIETGESIRYDYTLPLMAMMRSQHGTMIKYLTGGSGGHKLIPAFSDRCTGLDMSDDVLETMEAHTSLTGWKIVYGKGTVQSRTAGTVTVAFTDDNMLSIYKMLKVWTEYINAVYRGACMPKKQYSRNHILDYAISIYYFLTDSTGEDILFFSKYTGCFPTAAPASNFSDTLDNPIKVPSYSVPFSYAKKDDYNPINLAEFNKLSEDLGFDGIKTAEKDDWLAHRSFVGAPFVDTETGGYLYKIKFRSP